MMFLTLALQPLYLPMFLLQFCHSHLQLPHFLIFLITQFHEVSDCLLFCLHLFLQPWNSSLVFLLFLKQFILQLPAFIFQLCTVSFRFKQLVFKKFASFLDTLQLFMAAFNLTAQVAVGLLLIVQPGNQLAYFLGLLVYYFLVPLLQILSWFLRHNILQFTR